MPTHPDRLQDTQTDRHIHTQRGGETDTHMIHTQTDIHMHPNVHKLTHTHTHIYIRTDREKTQRNSKSSSTANMFNHCLQVLDDQVKFEFLSDICLKFRRVQNT